MTRRSPDGRDRLAGSQSCVKISRQFHWFNRDYWSTIITENRDIIQNGFIEIPDTPGIGLELNEEVAKAHQYPNTRWFE